MMEVEEEIEVQTKVSLNKWMVLLRYISEWDREGTIMFESMKNGIVPEKPTPFCTCPHCQAVVKAWEKEFENGQGFTNNFSPAPQIYPFLVLRLEATVVSEEHRSAVLNKCKYEMEWIVEKKDQSLADDLQALGEISKLCEHAVIGEELIR